MFNPVSKDTVACPPSSPMPFTGIQRTGRLRARRYAPRNRGSDGPLRIGADAWAGFGFGRRKRKRRSDTGSIRTTPAVIAGDVWTTRLGQRTRVSVYGGLGRGGCAVSVYGVRWIAMRLLRAFGSRLVADEHCAPWIHSIEHQGSGRRRRRRAPARLSGLTAVEVDWSCGGGGSGVE